jgi:hypothetical protein
MGRVMRRPGETAQYGLRPIAPYMCPMPEPVSLIMRQFLAWVGERPRQREEVREAWRSCPRISVWEDAVMDEFVAYGADGLIGLTARGRAALDEANSRDERVAQRPEKAA